MKVSPKVKRPIRCNDAALRARLRCRLLFLLLASLSVTACFSSEKGETFYGRVEVRPKQELRWSNGGLPRVFDPALAISAPDTDAVRAIFEGLTEIDSRTLTPVPAVAERWELSEQDRVWTFYLRSDARWSNGDPVTAADFLRAWKRALELGERVPHRALLANFEGTRTGTLSGTTDKVSDTSEKAFGSIQSSVSSLSAAGEIEVNVTPATAVKNQRQATENKAENKEAEGVKPVLNAFGVEVISPRVLRVRLVKPDPNFPALVAHPLFRPIHSTNIKSPDKRQFKQSESISSETDDNPTKRGTTDATGDKATDASRNTTDIPALPAEFDATISNGAFKLKNHSSSEVALERSMTYREAQKVALETVRFVAATNTETTLALYRAGEVDVVTNATFEPLTIKLLAPHEDFRRTTFGALNYYVFNRNLQPFNDVRVREAFAIAIDRGRLSRDTLGGATEPAYTFLPVQMATEKTGTNGDGAQSLMRTDQRRARQLLATAGFPGGQGFPIVRLLINRNDMHRTVAQAVAAMWREELGVETEVIVKDWNEYEAALRSGDYTIARRSSVMQTPDEQANIEMLFADLTEKDHTSSEVATASKPVGDVATVQATPAADAPSPTSQGEPNTTYAPAVITTHEQALRELPGIPLYFASSYALVKPYILDFDQNLFDAPLLKRVRVNSDWTPSAEKKIVITKDL